jgi:hypothetical protein
VKTLIQDFRRQVEAAYEAKKLSQMCYARLINRDFECLDDFDEPVADFIHSLKYAEYYILLDRIEKGEEMFEKETDPKKKSQLSKLLAQRIAEMEMVRP